MELVLFLVGAPRVVVALFGLLLSVAFGCACDEVVWWWTIGLVPVACEFGIGRRRVKPPDDWRGGGIVGII
jgi:hypothetical protein